MSTPNPNSLDQFHSRLTSLEEAVAYSERTIEDLDQVMRDFQKRLGTLESRFTVLAKHLGIILDSVEGGKPKEG